MQSATWMGGCRGVSSRAAAILNVGEVHVAVLDQTLWRVEAKLPYLGPKEWRPHARHPVRRRSWLDGDALDGAAAETASEAAVPNDEGVVDKGARANLPGWRETRDVRDEDAVARVGDDHVRKPALVRGRE